ncbi:MAG: hypothetical protein GY758_35320 [Fuerstiella sp.]|nr:hypothetical protein [Fuerstiella sp.]MCP4786100.1 hypothetical protein [Fuerstiella sp.]MCP4854773.1 hypothetical protein [Fuerstiella sp.]
MPRAGSSSTLFFAICVAAFANSNCAAEETAIADVVDNANWVSDGAADAVVEQVQFGGFRPQDFGRLPFATTTPRPFTIRSAQRSPTRQLLTSAPPTRRRRRLSRTPDMLGDSYLPPFHLNLQPLDPAYAASVNSQLPLAGGSARAKISENNKALPNDRLYFNYNHFHNAVQRDVFVDGFGQLVHQTAHVDRFTMGIERTLLSGDVSIGLNLPLTGLADADVNMPSLGPEGRFKSDTGTAGNLSLVGKRLLVNGEDLVVSCGLGIEFPTGADGALLTGTTLLSVENQSLFLQPFMAMTLDNGSTFVHSFLQVDIDVAESPLSFRNVTSPAPPVVAGDITQQTLVHWDTATGVWLARSDDQFGITGIAAIAEFHLSAAVSDGGQLAATVPTVNGPADLILGPAANRFTASYITTGIHMEIGQNQNLRVAGVFPLRDGVEKFFDAELLVQFGRRY